MKKTFKIGQKEYKFKKDAINHYRTILNSYEFGQTLEESDFEDLLDLLDYGAINDLADREMNEDIFEEKIAIEIDSISNEESEILVEDIKVSRVQFNTKCFEIFYNDKTSEYISYLMIINNSKYTLEKLFYIACRNSVHKDIKAVKQAYFDQFSEKGQVKCQETGLLSIWTELAVDHRQPNTFSIIVDRFIEVNSIELSKIEFTTNDLNFIVFNDKKLEDRFRSYHKEKASLRIVRKACNLSRSSLARLKRTSKDLIIS